MKKPRSRKDMIEYLTDHFRYSTMNSWNQAHSYAVKIKAHSLDLPHEAKQAVYAMLNVQDSYDDSGFNEILHEFDRRHSHVYQIGSNGRSGGYLVLYQGGTKPSEHKSVCRSCGQRNFQVADPEPGRCGHCAALDRYNRQFPPQPFTYPGKGLDEERDFAEWDMYSLRSRVDLVWDFDKTCAAAVKAYVEYALDNEVAEETVQVPTKILVSRPRQEAD